ncbi:hypothetical protein GC176_11710 [bacterium]|nr:hypothetical protein [bacterium]
MRLLTSAAALLIVLTSFDAGASADEKDRAVKLAEFRKSAHDDEETRTAIAGWRQFFLGAMQMHADEIAADCRLNADQKRHLDVAAKGVVERYVKRWTDAVAIRLIVMKEKDEEPELGGSFFDPEDTREIAWAVGTRQIIRIIQREPLWQQTLQKTLTPEQREFVEAKGRKRDERQIDVAVNWILDRLDQDYLLTEQQQARVKPLLRQHLSKATIPVSSHLFGQLYTLAWAYRIPDAEINKIFTPSQQQLWGLRAELFTEIGEDLWSENLLTDRWFDPDSLNRDGIQIPETE